MNLLSFPPESLVDWIHLLGILITSMTGLYCFVEMISYGIAKGFLAARRDHYRKLKGDMSKWKKENQGK